MTRRRAAWALLAVGAALVAAAALAFAGAWAPWGPPGGDGVAYVVIAGSGVALDRVERDALCAAVGLVGAMALIAARSAWRR